MVDDWASPPQRGQSPPSVYWRFSTASRRPFLMFPNPAIDWRGDCLSINTLGDIIGESKLI